PLQDTAPPPVQYAPSASSTLTVSSRPARNDGTSAASVSGRHALTAPSNVAPGPTSIQVPTPASPSVRMPSPNRTGSRACRTQYPGSVISSLASRPVSVLTTASDGAVNRTDVATRANASNIGSIRGEWNACETD